MATRITGSLAAFLSQVGSNLKAPRQTRVAQGSKHVCPYCNELGHGEKTTAKITVNYRKEDGTLTRFSRVRFGSCGHNVYVPRVGLRAWKESH